MSMASAAHRSKQLHLDLGQRDFAVATCPTCGMMYGKGLPEEERLHSQFHNAHDFALRFPGWSSERQVLRQGPRSRLLCVLPGDPPAHLNKVREVCARVEKALGIPEGYLLAEKPPYKVFLWVTSEVRGGAPAAVHNAKAARDLTGGGSAATSGNSAGASRSTKGGSGSNSSSGGGRVRGSRIAGVLVGQLQQRARRCPPGVQPPGRPPEVPPPPSPWPASPPPAPPNPLQRPQADHRGPRQQQQHPQATAGTTATEAAQQQRKPPHRAMPGRLARQSTLPLALTRRRQSDTVASGPLAPQPPLPPGAPSGHPQAAGAREEAGGAGGWRSRAERAPGEGPAGAEAAAAVAPSDCSSGGGAGVDVAVGVGVGGGEVGGGGGCGVTAGGPATAGDSPGQSHSGALCELDPVRVGLHGGGPSQQPAGGCGSQALWQPHPELEAAVGAAAAAAADEAAARGWGIGPWRAAEGERGLRGGGRNPPENCGREAKRPRRSDAEAGGCAADSLPELLAVAPDGGGAAVTSSRRRDDTGGGSGGGVRAGGSWCGPCPSVFPSPSPGAGSDPGHTPAAAVAAARPTDRPGPGPGPGPGGGGPGPSATAPRPGAQQRPGPSAPPTGAPATSFGRGEAVRGKAVREEAVRAVMGVRGVWVEPGSRRRGVARRMLDAARCCMLPGVVAARDQVAFSACAAGATAGDDDGGAGFAAFAASFRCDSGGGGRHNGAATEWVILYDDQDDDTGS